MRGHLKNLYARYERVHLRLTGNPQAIHDESGAMVACVDSVELREGRLHVVGWAFASYLSLRLAGMEKDAVPRLNRPDVATVFGGQGTVGFEISLPCDRATLDSTLPPGLVLTPLVGAPPIGPVSLSVPCSGAALWRVRWAFLRDLLRITPEMGRYFLTRDPVMRGRVKAKLRLDPRPVAGPLNDKLFRPDGAVPADGPAQRLTVVLPVYNAFDLLQECLRRVEAHSDLPCRLIMIEDCSPDERVRPFLRDWAGTRDWVELLENEENLGFIGAVNRGLDRAMAFQGADEGPVVLLNSDALVPQGWASRIVAPFASRPDLATVTPMSNDAEIMTVPLICQREMLDPQQADAIDAVAQRLDAANAVTEIPTGVGFCMAMSRHWLKRAGFLDPVFGRGYGEEVDLCRRMLGMGGKHLALGNLFVEHRGGESFGQEEKAVRIQESARIISQRYPDFDMSVQRFIASDPLHSARLALGLAWAGSLDDSRAVPVYLAHSMGGGADLYLRDRIAADLEQGLPSVVLRVGGKRRWRIELIAPNGETSGESDSDALIRQLLGCLPRRQIVYSCAVGDPDPVTIPEMLLSLMAENDSAQLLFHDYFPLSPDYTLMGSAGVYRGPVVAPSTDPANTTRRPDGSEVPLQVWQDAWRAFARRAEIVTFSPDSARHVAAVWPNLADHINIRPHRMLHAVPVLPSVKAGQPAVIAALGNINMSKGAAVLRDLSQRLAATQGAGPRLVLIGNIDPAYALTPPAVVHGSYDIADLPQLVKRYGITHWLIPSAWPETFCYTVREALATSMPVMAFDIGAQGEAVRAAANGIVLPYDDGTDLAARVLDAVTEVRRLAS